MGLVNLTLTYVMRPVKGLLPSLGELPKRPGKVPSSFCDVM